MLRANKTHWRFLFDFPLKPLGGGVFLKSQSRISWFYSGLSYGDLFQGFSGGFQCLVASST